MTLKVLPWPLHVMDTHTNRSAHMYIPQEYWMEEISWGNVLEGLDGTMHCNLKLLLSADPLETLERRTE